MKKAVTERWRGVRARRVLEPMVTEPVMRLVSCCTALVRGDRQSSPVATGIWQCFRIQAAPSSNRARGRERTMIMTWGIKWCAVESPIGIPPRSLRQASVMSRVYTRNTRPHITAFGLAPQAPFCTTSQHRVISCTAGPPFSLSQSSASLDIRDPKCLPLPSPTTLSSALGSSGP